LNSAVRGDSHRALNFTRGVQNQYTMRGCVKLRARYGPLVRAAMGDKKLGL